MYIHPSTHTHTHTHTAAPPPPPPTFTPPFQPVVQLTCCPIIHRVMHCVFKQAASVDSKFWSDKLLHETLYLCALMLSEENPTQSVSLCNAAMGRYGSKRWLCVFVLCENKNFTSSSFICSHTCTHAFVHM